MKQRSSGSWLALAFAVLFLPATAIGQSSASARDQPFWFGIGLGGAAVNSLAPAPAAGRDGVAASVEVGFRPAPDWGVGLEYGGVLPLSGCKQWSCGESGSDFAPNFTRIFAFGEFQPRNSGLRLRAGFGMSRFCYERHWSENAWSWGDTLMLLLDEDYVPDNGSGSGAWRCDAARKAMGGSLSVGYDWPVAADSASFGVRLTAEAANFSRSPGTDLPSFSHRAVLLTVHLNLR